MDVAGVVGVVTLKTFLSWGMLYLGYHLIFDSDLDKSSEGGTI